MGSVAHFSVANGQRVRKRHPSGGLIADGGSPCSAIDDSPRTYSGSGTGIASINAWVYGWSGCATTSCAGDDAARVQREAQRIAHDFWNARKQFSFVSPVGTIEECLAHGLDAPRPYMISDSGDNPGAGGADDVTVALAALLQWQPVLDGSLNVLYASIFDPASATTCWNSGVGAEVELELGGHVDTRDPGPIAVHGTVLATCDDPRGGHTALIKVRGLRVIVTQHRNQYTTFEQFARLGLDPRAEDVVVVKIGYLEPDLYAAHKDWMMALTPGGVDQDLIRLGHHMISRPMFPFDPDMADPDLAGRVCLP